MTGVGVAVFALAVSAIAANFALYPILLRWRAPRRGQSRQASVDLPRVSVVVAVRNGGDLIRAKIDNCLALDYPPDRLEIVVFSDGSADDSVAVAEAVAARQPRVLVGSHAEHRGKHEALNDAVAWATGELLLFTDTDALLAEDAVARLVPHFEDPEVGGVCGQRVLGEPGAYLGGAQAGYVSADSRIKLLESRAGSITSNDGKLYCIRRRLFTAVPPAVTDDLFQCLSVVRQGSRFVFEPQARAFIRTPSRSAGHELARRRRIVARSLHGISLVREVLDPRRFGRYAVGLLINKVGRRLLPFWLLLALLSSAVLAPVSRFMLVVLGLQLACYAAAALHAVVGRWLPGRLARLTSIPYFFCVGMCGTMLGVFDFLGGRRVARWDPHKRG